MKREEQVHDNFVAFVVKIAQTETILLIQTYRWDT